MKTKFIILGVLSAVILTACTNTNKETNQEANSKQTEINMEQKTINLTKAEFLTKVANYEENPKEWTYLGDKPCIIDFYADWCGPCKMVAPILEELAEEYKDEIYIYKVDTEAEQELAAAFGIRSIPSILFCPMGEQPQMAQGALPKDGFKQAIDEVLLSKN
ncbi:MAG TPA: thioredoxin [Dysgonamonadaceae bacterium]|nr:thioredoxin [Dysgonamonadaceae bacterium]